MPPPALASPRRHRALLRGIPWSRGSISCCWRTAMFEFPPPADSVEELIGRQVEAIASQIVGPVETLVFPNCGHSPHRDQPRAVLDAITRFVRTQSRPF